MNSCLSTILLTGWLALSFAGRCAAAPPEKSEPATPTVPETLRPPATESLAFVAHAKGVQVYECRAKKDDPAQFEWALKGPDADLFDDHGRKIGRHYAGPTWESTDGSKVVGEVKSRADSTDPEAIPWLLLVTKSREGSGVFSNVTSIQRLETAGGKAPAGNCDASTAGKEVRVPYTATYFFYRPSL